MLNPKLPLTIGIDINEANVRDRVGTGQYAYHLLTHWARTSRHLFHLYHRDPLQSDLPPETPHWQYHRVGPTRAWLRLGLPLHLLLSRRHHDVFWSPAHYAPLYTGCPLVVTIHDLAYEFYPDLFLPSDLYKLKNWTKMAVHQATRVIAVSAATKHDLVNLYGVPEAKITVVHNGYDSDVFNLSTQPDPQILKSYRLNPKSYILFLGTLQPRKNVVRLVQAFHLLKEHGFAGKLVLAGRIGWLAEESLTVIKNSPHAKDIVLTGYIDDQTRKSLYAHCDAFILPSLYEGFGVPVIEAMACGAPVAVANNSSLPEVVGSAGVLFDAHDPVDMGRALTELKVARATLVKKSLARARHFSWDQCAQETLKLLTQVAQSA